jgi:hypothetical protein
MNGVIDHDNLLRQACWIRKSPDQCQKADTIFCGRPRLINSKMGWFSDRLITTVYEPGYLGFPLVQSQNCMGGHLISAMIGVTGNGKIHNLGYLYVLILTGLGAAIMLVVALLVKKIP